MEDKSSNQLKYAMTYGAIIGLILVVYSVLLYLTGLTFNKSLGFIQYVVLFAGIYLGTKAYRDKALGGYIKYGKALVFGLIISVFVGIITVFFNFIMMRYIDPGLIDKIYGHHGGTLLKIAGSYPPTRWMKCLKKHANP